LQRPCRLEPTRQNDEADDGEQRLVAEASQNVARPEGIERVVPDDVIALEPDQNYGKDEEARGLERYPVARIEIHRDQRQDDGSNGVRAR
jgi:hypothetical protein